MKKIAIGIMSQEKIRERMLAIAKGEYKPKPGEPKIWFTSMKSLAEVLSDENRALLKTIRDAQPESISGLAAITGRKPGNLSRTLKTMSNYGIVEMRREKSPREAYRQCNRISDSGGVDDLLASKENTVIPRERKSSASKPKHSP